MEPSSELLRLLRAVGRAVEQDAPLAALRSADRAWRQYPDNIEIASIYARLLLRMEEPRQALHVAERAAQRGEDPDLQAILIDALAASGEAESAARSLAESLSRYALVPGGPLALAARRIAQGAPGERRGFIGLTPDLHLWGEIVGVPNGAGRPTEVTVTLGDWRATETVSGDRASAAAAFGIAPPLVDEPLVLTATADGMPLIGSDMPFPPDFRVDGRVTAQDGEIAGWARLAWSPKSSVAVRLAGDAAARILAAVPDPADPRRHRFSLVRDAEGAAGNCIGVSLRLPNGRWHPLPDSPLLIEPGPAPPARRRRSPRRRPAPLSEQIDVIVPVYGGCDETLACIASLMTTVGPAGELIVIDDATPETALAAALDALARSGRITLLRNPQNLGFPATVNRGFSLHPDRDVVIVNSDTQLFDDWLIRLRAAAYSAPDIGTVTPLTNAGSLASYPADGKRQPNAAQAAELARLTARVNAAAGVELPTGVGFCLYIRRDCLREVGDFDAATFDKGYGEENDFCLRATAAGWRHWLAADVFVRHQGARSFGSRREALTERGLRLLDLRYPHYRQLVETFLAAAPARPLRRRLDEELLIGRAGRCVLLLTHALPGGVERHVNDRIRTLNAGGLAVLRLQPRADGSNTCVLVADDASLQDLHYDADGELDLLRDLLARLLIEHIEIHHTLDLAPQVVEAVIDLGIPYDVVVHDYALVCPRIMFSQANGRYCGMPELSACEACIRTHGSLLRETIGVGELRERSARWLRGARSITVPTRDAAERLARYFPDLGMMVQPWERLAAALPYREPHASTPLRVVVIGAIGERKGYDMLLACVRDARARNLPVEFTIIGHTMDDGPLLAAGPAFITGRYSEAEIGGLIRRENPDVALFPYITPETWCYTLSHALEAGLPIVAFDIGAIAERLRGSAARYRLVPLETDAGSLNDQLLQFHADLLAIAEARIDLAAPAGPPQTTGSHEFFDFAHDDAMLGVINNIQQQHVAVQTQREVAALTASAEALSLEPGLYLFSVRHASPLRVGGERGIVLPALHVGPAPGVPPGHVTMMTSPGAGGAWLYRPNDVFVVRVTKEVATIIVTSIRTERMGPLGIEVRRLDAPNGLPAASPADLLQAGQPAAPAPGQPAPEAAAPANGAGNAALRVQIVAHVQNRGDLLFTGPGWAGCLGQRLPVEAFSIHPLELIGSDRIEYKAFTATGIETGWVSNGGLCGTRGIGVPLIGFAARLKNAADAAHYECSYSGAFTSGRRLGPFTDGVPCRGADPDDRLEGIQLLLTPRTPAADRRAVADPASPVAPSAPPKPASRRRLGPRFSALREPPEA